MAEDPTSTNGNSSEHVSDADAVNVVAGLAEAVKGAAPQDERRMIFAKGENYRHIRHAEIMDRWPVIAEPWARRIEMRRVAVDRTPGTATFGR